MGGGGAEVNMGGLLELALGYGHTPHALVSSPAGVAPAPLAHHAGPTKPDSQDSQGPGAGPQLTARSTDRTDTKHGNGHLPPK